VNVYCTKHAQLLGIVRKQTPAHTWVEFITLSPRWKAHHAAEAGWGERHNSGTNLSLTTSPVKATGCTECGPRMLDAAVLLQAFEEGRDKISL
jgi:hypothetical protein